MKIYGGERRRYGGAGRSSLNISMSTSTNWVGPFKGNYFLHHTQFQSEKTKIPLNKIGYI